MSWTGSECSAAIRATASLMLAGIDGGSGSADESPVTERGWITVTSTRFSVTGLDVNTMLRTSFPDRLSGRTMLVYRCAVSGDSAHTAPASWASISVEQK